MISFKNQKNIYISLAMLLSGVTAISISLSVFKLISDPFLAIVFAVAAVGLDVFKYASWPLVIRLHRARKRVLSASLVVCALTLAGISAWATFDRMTVSMAGENAQIRALKSERLNLLRSQISADMLALTAKAPAPENNSEPQRETLSSLYKQAAEMRARGMATKAVEFESSTVASAEKRLEEIVARDSERTAAAIRIFQAEREEARARIAKNSAEAMDIEALVEKGSSIPPLLILLICAGFAIALEIFPSLILASLASLELAPQATTSADEMTSEEALQATQPHEESAPLAAPLVETNGVEDELLVNQLLTTIEQLKSGDPVKIKDFATAARIGTMRACSLFKLVADAGFIEKTGNGYKKSLKIFKTGVASA